MRGLVRVRETETRRHIRAATLEGLTVERIEISSDGRVSLITTRSRQDPAPGINEWDKIFDGPRKA
jgi:hypothetical protein